MMLVKSETNAAFMSTKFNSTLTEDIGMVSNNVYSKKSMLLHEISHTINYLGSIIIIDIDWLHLKSTTYRTLSSSTNITTTRACGFELKCSIIRSKSSDLALRDTFSDTAIQIPSDAAIEMNDEIP